MYVASLLIFNLALKHGHSNVSAINASLVSSQFVSRHCPWLMDCQECTMVHGQSRLLWWVSFHDSLRWPCTMWSLNINIWLIELRVPKHADRSFFQTISCLICLLRKLSRWPHTTVPGLWLPWINNELPGFPSMLRGRNLWPWRTSVKHNVVS